MIQFNCPSCQASYRVPEIHQGAKTTCRQCRQPLQVPMVAIAAAEAPASVPPRPPGNAAPQGPRFAAALARIRAGTRPQTDWLLKRPLVLAGGLAAVVLMGCLGVGGAVALSYWSSDRKPEIAQAGTAPKASATQPTVRPPQSRPVAASQPKVEPRPATVPTPPPPPPKVDPAQPKKDPADETDWVKLVKSAPPGPSLSVQKQEWLKQTVLDAYDRAGRKDPRWDNDARKLLQLSVATWDERFNELTGMLNAYQAVTRAGCNDPLVLYVVGRLTTRLPQDKVAQDLAAVGCHPAHRCMAWARAAIWFADQEDSPDRARQAQRCLDESLRLLSEVALDKSVPIGIVMEVCRELEDGHRVLEPDRKRAFDKIDPVLQKARPDSSLVYTYRGHFHTSYAWDARGGGYANTVGQDRFRIFRERLGHAATALEKAWELDTSNSDAAAQMITVEMGQGEGRGRMDKWFFRAMGTDADNYAACRAKLLYLEPKWHGNMTLPITFGKECLATGNWKSRIPLCLVDAHEAVLPRWVSPAKYFERPEVWQDIQAVFEGYLQAYPQATFERSRYALWACRCQKWDVADRQFTTLGENAQKHVFENAAQYEQLREEAARRAKK